MFIYDGVCANERRRRQKRGLLAPARRFVVINPEVCENCGHCGALTNCMSLHKVDTEFGPKTVVHPSSCNQDESCLGGDCPSFLTVQAVTSKDKKPARKATPEAPSVVDPVLATKADVFLAGIGGTGIVTVNQLLATAALRFDLDTTGLSGLDQVGLSQKAGPVTSHLRCGDKGPANRVGHATADVVLAFDALVMADPKNLAVCSPDFSSCLMR